MKASLLPHRSANTLFLYDPKSRPDGPSRGIRAATVPQIPKMLPLPDDFQSHSLRDAHQFPLAPTPLSSHRQFLGSSRSQLPSFSHSVSTNAMYPPRRANTQGLEGPIGSLESIHGPLSPSPSASIPDLSSRMASWHPTPSPPRAGPHTTSHHGPVDSAHSWQREFPPESTRVTDSYPPETERLSFMHQLHGQSRPQQDLPSSTPSTTSTAVVYGFAPFENSGLGPHEVGAAGWGDLSRDEELRRMST